MRGGWSGLSWQRAREEGVRMSSPKGEERKGAPQGRLVCSLLWEGARRESGLLSAVRSGPNEGKGGAAGKEERPGTISPVASCCGEEEKPKGGASCRLENGKKVGLLSRLLP